MHWLTLPERVWVVAAQLFLKLQNLKQHIWDYNKSKLAQRLCRKNNFCNFHLNVKDVGDLYPYDKVGLMKAKRKPSTERIQCIIT